MRRAVAVVVILVLVILIVLGVHSCQVSARNSALRDYANNVSSLVQQSDQTGSQFFQALTGGGASGATGLQNQLNENRVSADAELSHARGIDVPDEVKGAQQNFVLALQMRRDGIGNIATYIQPALGASASKDAIDSIAAEMARIYASDALYTDYAAPMIASALHAAGLAVGGANGVTIAAGQFLPDIRWLTPSFVAAELRVSLPSSGGKPAPG
ncbi:MAG: hypothetical protein JO169_04870, partial [Solirubrobacterales bacterium]|nr:hypothetical protein [Solirubrobacterales bacterium]